LPAQALDAKLNDITGLQPHLRPQTHSDSGRGAGVDQIARFQNQELAEIVNDEVRVEDHSRGRPMLAAYPTHVEPHVRVEHVIDLVRG
jgi:hypothetical protein